MGREDERERCGRVLERRVLVNRKKWKAGRKKSRNKVDRRDILICIWCQTSVLCTCIFYLGMSLPSYYFGEKRSLRQACTSAESYYADPSLIWATTWLTVWSVFSVRSMGFMLTVKTVQIGWMPRLIWVFAGPTGHFVGFVMLWLVSEKSHDPLHWFIDASCQMMNCDNENLG